MGTGWGLHSLNKALGHCACKSYIPRSELPTPLCSGPSASGHTTKRRSILPIPSPMQWQKVLGGSGDLVSRVISKVTIVISTYNLTY